MSRRTRIVAAVIMAPVAICAVLFLPTPWLAVLLASLLMLGLWEWTELAGIKEKTPRLAYLAGNALLMTAVVWGAGHGLFTLKLLSVIGATWWLFVLIWLARYQFASADTPLNRIIKLLAGTLCAVPAWAALCWLHASTPHGAGWALFALAIAWAADTGAYFVGVRFGRVKLAPRISPGKTREGLAGGLACSLLLALAALPLLGLSWNALPQMLLLTLVTALMSVVGDLYESLLKRHADAKDSSNLIPGHGGLLDRLDSLLAALPVFVVAKVWLGL